MTAPSFWLAWPALAGLAACAAPAPDAPAAPAGSVATSAPVARLRVLVKLAAPSSDASAIARRASAAAGVPVRYLAPTSERWHAVALECGSATACDAALNRLAADSAAFEAVQIDDRRRATVP